MADVRGPGQRGRKTERAGSLILANDHSAVNPAADRAAVPAGRGPAVDAVRDAADDAAVRLVAGNVCGSQQFLVRAVAASR